MDEAHRLVVREHLGAVWVARLQAANPGLRFRILKDGEEPHPDALGVWGFPTGNPERPSEQGT